MLHHLDLFYREITPSKAYVYARLPWPDESRDWQLAGRVRGPFTRRGHTLPSNAALEDLGSSPSAFAGYMLARATVIDPCTWSPDAPNMYLATVELLRQGEVRETIKREIGLRDLRPQKNNLFLDAKRWVLRGVHGDGFANSPHDWRQASAVRITGSIDESWLIEAAGEGAMVVIRLDDPAQVDVHLLRRIARFTSAAMVVLPNPANLPDDVRLFAPNLLLAQQASAASPPAAWAHAAWVEMDSVEGFAGDAAGLSLPIIAVRRGRFDSLTVARAACDQLQADLAPLGQYAGYVV